MALFPGIVLFCVWVYRANVNADALVSAGMEFTPGWAVGWFFVPIANLFKPYQVVSEIYRASDPEGDPGFWNVASVPFFIPLWWASWIAFNFVARWNQPLFESSLWSRTPGPGALLLEGVLGTLAAILVIVITQSVHRHQVQRARRPAAVGDASAPRANPYL